MDQDSIKTRLSENDFFLGLGPELIDFLAARATARELRENELLFRHGDRAAYFYLIVDGAIGLEVPAIQGPVLELQDLGPGEIVGWSWLISPYKWSFQARAKTRTELLEFDGKAILERCENDTAFGYELLKRFSSLMSERLSAARQKMMAEWNPLGFA